jgi:hypothetical protein
MKAKLVASVVAASTLSTAYSTEPCNIAWKDGHKAAIERGLSFLGTLQSGTGTCFVHGGAFLASASNEDAAVCDFVFFSGAKLNSGWKISVFSNDAFQRIAAGPDSPPVVRVKAGVGETFRFVPTRLEVEGPAKCDDWRKALEAR